MIYLSEKRLNSRIVQKHDIEVNWLKAVNFIPKIGEIIVYDPDENHAAARVKIGDGVKTVVELAFINDAAKAALFKEIDMVDEKVEALSELVGNTSVQEQIDAEITEWVGDKTVSEQINIAVAKKADIEHTHSEYVNQNAFGKVTVGSTTIAADTAIDTLTLVAGSNVTITPDATNDKVTIAATDTVYTHPTTSGNKHIPNGGSSGQILRWSADGTAVWGADNDTTYSVATQSAQGLMSAADKVKLDGIASGANKTTVDSALSSTSTNPVQNKIVNTALSEKVPMSRKINNKALTADITLSASDVGADASGTATTKANAALVSAKSYTDTKIAALVDSAPTTLDTLAEIATAIQENETVVEALNSAIGNKVDKVSGKGLSTNDYTTTEKNKLSGIASGAEVNQNAFSTITVGTTAIAADSKTDTFTIVAGSNITLTPDVTNDKMTIAAKDTVYTHPTHTAKNSGLYKVAVDGYGHVSAATAVVKSDITGLGIPAQDTTYSNATTSAAGLMSADDKTKLDGIVQSDWNENDETSMAYVQNRTHYTVSVSETTFISVENTSEYDIDPPFPWVEVPGDYVEEELSEGQSIRVHCFGKDFGELTIDTYWQNNKIIINDDTANLHFRIYQLSTSSWEICYDDGSNRITGFLEISYLTETIVQLPEKYIPNTIARTADLAAITETDPTVPSWAKAASKPSYTASEIAAGTFKGQVTANTSAQTPATSLLRNSKLVTAETNPSNNGEICWLYE